MESAWLLFPRARPGFHGNQGIPEINGFAFYFSFLILNYVKLPLFL
jgi:hypothetical protein